MLMVGSRSFAIDSSTRMFVSRIEIQPSILILCFLTTSSISFKTSIPWSESRAVLWTRWNMSWRSLKQIMFSFSFRGAPLTRDTRQIHLAHSKGSPLMTSSRNMVKFFFFSGVKLTVIPTSMRMISTFSLYFSTNFAISFSYSQFSSLSLLRNSESKPYLMNWEIRQFLALLKTFLAFLVTWFDQSLIRTRMLPPWQSAWTKLYFISIAKKALAPKLAITLLRPWSLASQELIVLPSMNYSMRTSLVDSGQVMGKKRLLSTTTLLKRSMFCFYFRKESCSERIRFRDQWVTGISKNLEKKERKRLTPNMRSISLERLCPTQGCLTFTATFFPFNLAEYTWLTDPEAIGVVLNYSNISSIALPYTLQIVYTVFENQC